MSDECLFLKYLLDIPELMPSCSTPSKRFPGDSLSKGQKLTSTPEVFLVNTSLTVNIGRLQCEVTVNQSALSSTLSISSKDEPSKLVSVSTSIKNRHRIKHQENINVAIRTETQAMRCRINHALHTDCTAPRLSVSGTGKILKAKTQSQRHSG